MLLTGQFRNIDNELFTVKILTDGDSSTTRTIGENGLYFGDDPVMITTDCDSSFEHIIRKSCEINLVCSDYIGDALYANNSRSIVLNIKKEPSQEVVFAGYVEPNTFNQPFAKPLEEFTINATDALSTLQYYKYKNCTLNNYDQLKTTVSSATFYDIIEGMFDDFITELDIDGDVEATLIYDCSKGLEYGEERTIFNDLAISESYIMGEEFDDCMTQEEVLQQIMQYLNLHIIQEGFNFWIFDWNTLRNKRNSWWDIINTRSVRLDTPSTITFTRAMHGKDDTNITIDDVYNQISVKCDIEDEEVVIESPFEDSDIDSLFKAKQLYCREYITAVSKRQHGYYASENFRNMLVGRSAADEDYESKIIDWYMRPIYNKKWKFHPNNGTGDITDIYMRDSNGKCINQWNIAKYVYQNRLTPCMFSMGSVEMNGKNVDNEPKGKISMSDYIYISINGNKDDNYATAEPSEAQLLSNTPLIEYIGNANGASYSPPDEDTTNYLVFSGKMQLQPVLDYREDYATLYMAALDSIEHPENEMTDRMTLALFAHVPTDKEVEDSHADEKGRLYTRKFFTMRNSTDPTDEEAYLDGSFSLNPPVKDVGTKELPYKYTSKDYINVQDMMTKLPILECELIIGNKRLIETDVDEWGNSVFQWVNLGEEPTYYDEEDQQTYTISTFTLGVNPKINDYIIGNEFNIQNTIYVHMNLDTEGTAIPITKDVQLNGAVQFRILGTINSIYNEITRRKNHWWQRTRWYQNNRVLLAHVQNIIIKDFKCEIFSDKAGTEYIGDEKDLIYMSDETDKFINKNDETTFKFITQLTSEEAIDKGVKQAVYVNSVINANDGVPLLTIYNATTQETAKAEEHYVDQYYTEYSSPKLILEATMHDDSNIDWRYKYYSGVLDRNFIIQAMEKNLKYNNATITFKEV